MIQSETVDSGSKIPLRYVYVHSYSHMLSSVLFIGLLTIFHLLLYFSELMLKLSI